MNPVHFSSRTDDWATPQWLFDLLDAEFGFTLDVCAVAGNAKCRHYFSPDKDSLEQDWRGVCWMNPPYGRPIARIVEKAHQSALQGSTVVCLLPARTDTTYWHRVIAHAAEIRFLKGRLKFGGAPNSAPFPSAVVVFRAGKQPQPQVRFVDLADVQRNLFGC